jgi:hypothetical protein
MSDDEKCCDVCGLGDEDPPMLLCDTCDSGFHVSCLSPPLDRVPEGPWFCHRCHDDPNGELGELRRPTESARNSPAPTPFDLSSALDLPIDDVFQLRDVVVSVPTSKPNEGGSLSTLFKTIFDSVLAQLESYDAVNRQSLIAEISELEDKVTKSVRDEFSSFRERLFVGREDERRPTPAVKGNPRSSPSCD